MRRIVHCFRDGRCVEACLDETLISQDRNGGDCVRYNGHWMTATAAQVAAGGSGNGWLFWYYQRHSDGSWKLIEGFRHPERFGGSHSPTA